MSSGGGAETAAFTSATAILKWRAAIRHFADNGEEGV